MRWVLIGLAVALVLGIGWVAGGRQLTALIDRVRTVRVTALPVPPLSYRDHSLHIGQHPVGLPVDLSARRDSLNRLVVSSGPNAWHSNDLFETVIAPLANAEHPPRFRF